MREFEKLLNIIRREIERFHAQRFKPNRTGLVTSYDPDAHAAKVMFQPEGVESGWIPITTHHIGNGWGVAIGLTPGDGTKTGDQVEVSFQEGDYETGRIVNRIHSDQDKPPRVEAGEILVQHQDGRFVKFDKAGNSIIKHGLTKAQTTILADGTMVHMAKKDPSIFFYLGHEEITPGQRPTDNKYALVQTAGGTAINVKAQIAD